MSNHRWKTCLRIISCNPTPKRWHLRCRRTNVVHEFQALEIQIAFVPSSSHIFKQVSRWRNNVKLSFDLKLKEKSDFFHYVHQLHTKSISSQRNSDVRNSSHYWVCPLEICHSAVVELSPWLKAIEQRSLACLKVCWSFFSNRFLYWGY